jgi:1-acyl-sn-glycerol-3-phosphate acyltransferase
MPEAAPMADASELEERVLGVVRELAGELGGSRAQRAVAPGASLERDVGLGSLERVELMLRLERALGRRLDDDALAIDTPAELARALRAAEVDEPARGTPRPEGLSAAAPLDAPVGTVHEALWRRAIADPDRPHAYVRQEDGSEVEISYGRLLAEARTIAGGLREHGVRGGDTVALMLPTGRDFLRSFQGILVAGAIPVPIYPPARLDRLDEYALRQSAILADAGVRVLITVPRGAGVARLLRPAVPSLSAVVTADDLAALGASWPVLEGSGDDPAFIQYTSGSTGHPKGVLLTHGNLLANIRAIAIGLEAAPTDVGASWLPLYHDMGLIGSWLFCLCQGLPIAILSPLAFLARPERWLWTIHQRRATLSAAPNFAYELCVRKIADAALEGLDLSSWRCALNGAEPVHPDTLERFARRFAPFGLRREALMPVYGLAECSVALCFPPVGRGPRVDVVSRKAFEEQGRAEAAAEGEATVSFVGAGRALPGHEVRTVDETGAEVPERTVGRLVFRGPSATAGYFRKPEATAAITLPGGWLDSGDLAYVADGEVFIAGRLKDLIIKAGRNLVPQEIEEAAASVEGVRRGCVVALGVSNEAQATESLVVVAETRVVDAEARDRLAAAITERVATAVGVPPDVVAMVSPGVVPKTSSGKIRRSATRDLYLKGLLGQAPRTPAWRRGLVIAEAAWAEARPRLTALARGLYAGYLAMVVGALALLAWPAAALLPWRRAVRFLERTGARLALWAAGCPLSIEGTENLTGVGPCLFVSNHTSYADIPALLALVPRSFVFVAKREVLRWPVVGLFARKAGHLTVDRADARDGVSTAADVARAIEDGESVLVFPEATFTAAAGLRPFRMGAFKTAVETGTPVVPLALRGARQVLRDGRRVPRPGPIHIWVGRPISPEGSGWRAVVELRDRAAEAIAAHCGEPRLDLVAAGPPTR